jgi:flagellar biosynthesis repressor protein FlbT
MKNTLKISLRANEKIYVNGAVIRADRKVSLEFLNDVQFLLEHHVLQAEDATTPLRQLYFIVQVMLITPDHSAEARDMFRKSLPLLLQSFGDEHILASLKHVDQLISEGRAYEAMKLIRGLYPFEERALTAKASAREAMPVREPMLAMAAGA